MKTVTNGASEAHDGGGGVYDGEVIFSVGWCATLGTGARVLTLAWPQCPGPGSGHSTVTVRTRLLCCSHPLTHTHTHTHEL